jgi:hypothetical protein
MWLDLRHGARTLLKHPGFSAVAVLVLALGIGVNTAIFSLVNAVLLKSFPVRAPEELAFIYRFSTSRFGGPIDANDLTFFRENNPSFSQLTGHTHIHLRVAAAGETEEIDGELVATDYFDVASLQRWAEPLSQTMVFLQSLIRP